MAPTCGAAPACARRARHKQLPLDRANLRISAQMMQCKSYDPVTRQRTSCAETYRRPGFHTESLQITSHGDGGAIHMQALQADGIENSIAAEA
jgi:hypothetical protein